MVLPSPLLGVTLNLGKQHVSPGSGVLMGAREEGGRERKAGSTYPWLMNERDNILECIT